jgi:hypothetical protein
LQSPEHVTIVGVTGHQDLDDRVRTFVRSAFLSRLKSLLPIQGVSSLAKGTDQLFAECVLALGGELVAVVPSSGYESTFDDRNDLARFHRFLADAIDVVRLSFPTPSETAFWAAGKEVVDRSDVLLAVWDGRPARGLGGTADIVRYARDRGKTTEIIWPRGAQRNS